MLGSLYYGRYGDPVLNIAKGVLFPASGGFTPCELCRYARILMYPLVLISLIAFFKKDTKAIDTILVFSILGVALEIYHYGLQKINFQTSFVCTYVNPCEALQVNYRGFLTIPLLCLVAFCVILGVASAMKFQLPKKG
jgi:disulfide bond formation protein DsbB